MGGSSSPQKTSESDGDSPPPPPTEPQDGSGDEGLPAASPDEAKASHWNWTFDICDNCIERDSHCDGRKPFCRRCADFRRECVYSQQRRVKSGPRTRDTDVEKGEKKILDRVAKEEFHPTMKMEQAEERTKHSGESLFFEPRSKSVPDHPCVSGSAENFEKLSLNTSTPRILVGNDPQPSSSNLKEEPSVSSRITEDVAPSSSAVHDRGRNSRLMNPPSKNSTFTMTGLSSPASSESSEEITPNYESALDDSETLELETKQELLESMMANFHEMLPGMLDEFRAHQREQRNVKNTGRMLKAQPGGSMGYRIDSLPRPPSYSQKFRPFSSPAAQSFGPPSSLNQQISLMTKPMRSPMGEPRQEILGPAYTGSGKSRREALRPWAVRGQPPAASPLLPPPAPAKAGRAYKRAPVRTPGAYKRAPARTPDARSTSKRTPIFNRLGGSDVTGGGDLAQQPMHYAPPMHYAGTSSSLQAQRQANRYEPPASSAEVSPYTVGVVPTSAMEITPRAPPAFYAGRMIESRTEGMVPRDEIPMPQAAPRPRAKMQALKRLLSLGRKRNVAHEWVESSSIADEESVDEPHHQYGNFELDEDEERPTRGASISAFPPPLISEPTTSAPFIPQSTRADTSTWGETIHPQANIDLEYWGTPPHGAAHPEAEDFCSPLDEAFLGALPDVSGYSFIQSLDAGGNSDQRGQLQDSGGSSEQSAQPARKVRKKSKSLHRAKHGSKDASDDEQDDSSGRHPKRQKTPTEHGSEEHKKLACPFYKKNPRKYANCQACTGPGWNTTHRLKEHLYRKHTLLPCCPRCQLELDSTSKVDTHLLSDPPCQVQAARLRDGVTPKQEKLLRSRKRNDKMQTETEKWRKIYLILFPETDPKAIPSPFYNISPPLPPSVQTVGADGREEESSGGGNDGGRSLDEYEEFLKQELPSRVRQELERRIDNAVAVGPVDERMKTELVDIVHKIQLSLLSSFREGRRASSLSSSSSSSPLPHYMGKQFEGGDASKDNTVDENQDPFFLSTNAFQQQQQQQQPLHSIGSTQRSRSLYGSLALTPTTPPTQGSTPTSLAPNATTTTATADMRDPMIGSMRESTPGGFPWAEDVIPSLSPSQQGLDLAAMQEYPNYWGDLDPLVGMNYDQFAIPSGSSLSGIGVGISGKPGIV